MNKEFKVYELIINEDDESGVDQIALVDQPAIERNWETFNSQPVQKFAIEDEEKRIASGYFMIADLPIVRYNEEDGEHYVKFSKATIEKIVNKHFKEGHVGTFNLMHDQDRPANDVFLIESIIVDSKRGTKAPENFKDAPDGSWWGSVRVLNDDVWNQIKSGEFKGFSVEGIFERTEPTPTKEEVIEEVIKQIQFNTWLTEWVNEDGKVMCDDVLGGSFTEARENLVKQGRENQTIVGRLIDTL